jgi:hypothetical protein
VSDWSQFPALATSRAWSTTRLALLSEGFLRASPELTPIVAVVAAGSLGRLEAHAVSDLDCILLRTGEELTPTTLEGATRRVMSIIERCGLKAPKKNGIFCHAITAEELCEPTAHGNLNEPVEVFGKRIQLLLDTRAIVGHAEFLRVRQRVVEWYSYAGRVFAMEGPWDFLARDLARYVHSYWNWQLFKFNHTNEDSWYLRQAKLRSSRLLTWFGLWVLLSEAANRGNAGSVWFEENLDRTPLERIALVLGRENPAMFNELASAYDFILGRLAEPRVREALLDSTHEPRQGYQVGDLPDFDRIIEASNIIRSCIGRFIQIRQNSVAPGVMNFAIYGGY